MRMWKILDKSTPLLIQFNQENDILILITDFVHIWSTTLTKSEFLSCVKRSNDNLQFSDDNKLWETGTKMFSEVKLESFMIDRDKKTMTISLVISIDKLDLKFQVCELIKQNEEYYFQYVTQPLLKTVKDLRKSENILQSFLLAKDKEIKKYKKQNVNILYSSKTDSFVKEKHFKDHNVYESYFGQSDIPDAIVERKFDNNTDVKPKAEIIKTEPQSNTEDQLPTSIKMEQESIKSEPAYRRDRIVKRRKHCLNY